MEELIKKELERLASEQKAANEQALKAAEAKAAEMVKAANDAFEAKAKEIEEKANERVQAIEVKADERQKAMDEALTAMNKAKEAQRKERIKSLSGHIFEALSEKEAAIADFVKNKRGFDVELKEFNVKAVTAMGVTAGTVAEEWNGNVGVPHVQQHMRNVIPVSPTQSNMIKYNQFTKKEGAIGTVAAGAAKPQLDYNVTPKEAPVRKIAGFVQVYDEFLEDVAGSRDFLAAELPQALLDVEDNQIVFGDGVGENLAGLWTSGTALTLPKGTVNTDSNVWDKLAAGLAQSTRTFRLATAAFVSPEDYMEMLINKGNTDEYTYPIIANANGQITMGGMPVYQHPIFAKGQGLLGDFVRGVRIFQKMAPIVKFSTEHGTNFTTNQTTVLIEERIALPIYYPESFIKLDLNITPVV